jgi:hypothetical protein
MSRADDDDAGVAGIVGVPLMSRADDDDAGVAGIVGVPPACGGEWR